MRKGELDNKMRRTFRMPNFWMQRRSSLFCNEFSICTRHIAPPHQRYMPSYERPNDERSIGRLPITVPLEIIQNAFGRRISRLIALNKAVCDWPLFDL